MGDGTMKVREYLETLNKNDQVTMILMRPEYRSKGLPDDITLTVYQETPINSVETWLESTSMALDREIRAFDFPTLSAVWYNWQQMGRIKVILVDCMPYEISKPGEAFLHRKKV